MNFQVTYLKPFGVILEPKSKNTNVNELDLKTLHTKQSDVGSSPAIRAIWKKQ